MNEALAQIRAEKVVAVIRAQDELKAHAAAAAAVAGGLKILEITFTTPGAAGLISKLKREYPRVLVGAGSIATTGQAEEAVAAGAAFCVSPHTDQRLIAYFAGRDLLYVPGGMTPTELMTGYNLGCRLLKLFPGATLGVSGVTSILQPLPFLPVVVTGGVDENNARAFLAAGAIAVCTGSSVFSSKHLAADDWQAVERGAERLYRACHGQV